MNFKQEIEKGHKAYKRGGDFLYRIFHGRKTILDGEECMKIFNMYGIHTRDIVLLAASHGYSIDEDGFEKLYEEQERAFKGMKQCTNAGGIE